MPSTSVARRQGSRVDSLRGVANGRGGRAKFDRDRRQRGSQLLRPDGQRRSPVGLFPPVRLLRPSGSALGQVAIGGRDLVQDPASLRQSAGRASLHLAAFADERTPEVQLPARRGERPVRLTCPDIHVGHHPTADLESQQLLSATSAPTQDTSAVVAVTFGQ